MAIPSFSAFHDEGINLEGLLEILSPENNLVLADDMMVSDGNGIIPPALRRRSSGDGRRSAPHRPSTTPTKT